MTELAHSKLEYGLFSSVVSETSPVPTTSLPPRTFPLGRQSEHLTTGAAINPYD